jgi:hypothetical protein
MAVKRLALRAGKNSRLGDGDANRTPLSRDCKEVTTMIEKLPMSSGKVLGFRLSGKLHDEDYQTFVPLVEEALAAEGKLSLLAQLEDFHGWDMHAAWDDLKLGLKHYSDFERLALVGDEKWEEWMARIAKPFTKAEVKYFGKDDLDDAWRWVRGE